MPRAVSLLGTAGWPWPPIEPRSSCQGVSTTRLLFPGLFPRPGPKVAASGSSVPGPSPVPSLCVYLRSIYPCHTPLLTQGECAQGLTDYNTKHSNSSFGNNIFKLQTQTLLQIPFSCLSHEQTRFATGWPWATSDEDMQSPPARPSGRTATKQPWPLWGSSVPLWEQLTSASVPWFWS